MINKVWIWYLMLNKRLLKKTGFLIILILIPVFAFIFQYFVEQDNGGLMRIALALEDSEDAVAKRLLERVNQPSQVFDFTVCHSEEEAKRQVAGAKAEAAWVFVDDMDKRMQEIATGKDRAIVKVYESEENTFLNISREKIFSVLYPEIAYYIYEDYITNEMLADEEISDERLQEAYEVIGEEDSFIEFSFLDSNQEGIEDANYLTSTLRGLLIVLMLLAGMAATMYHLTDREEGLFSWLPIKKWIFVSWGNNLAALSMAAVFVTIALIATGNYTSFWQETVAMVLFILAGSVFCSTLGVLLQQVHHMCVAVPAILVLCIVFCPVFFNIRVPMQQILPPYYYLYAIHSYEFVIWQLLYCVAGYPLCYILNKRCTF